MPSRFVDFFAIKKYMIVVGRKEKRLVTFQEAYRNVLKGKTPER